MTAPRRIYSFKTHIACGCNDAKFSCNLISVANESTAPAGPLPALLGVRRAVCRGRFVAETPIRLTCNCGAGTGRNSPRVLLSLPDTYAALQQPFFSRIRTTTTPCTKTHPDTSKYDSGPSPNQHRITLATVAYARPSPGVCAAFGAGRKRYVETSPSRVRWRDATMDANQSQKIVCGCECEVTL